MHTTLHLVLSEDQISNLFYSLVDTAGCVLLWLALHAARRAQNGRMAYWIMPLLIGFACDWVDNVVNAAIRLTGAYEKDPLYTITDVVSDIGVALIAVGAYRLWKLLQSTPVPAPAFPDYGPAEQGIWPPPPQKPPVDANDVPMS